MESRQPLLKVILYASLVGASLICSSAATTDKKSKDSQDILPALKVLPAGSKLKGVQIPRYNSNYSPASLLLADEIQIVTKDHIHGTGVKLSLFDKKGNLTLKTDLNSIDYHQGSQLIQSYENLVFQGSDFITATQGMILDWKNRRGFFLGKNQTILYIKKSDSMKENKKKSRITNRKKIIPAVASAAILSSPTFLSANDQEEYNRLSIPSTEKFNVLNESTREEISLASKISQTADMHEAELIQAIKKTELEVVSDQKKLTIPPDLKPEKGRDHFTIRSEGNVFFDSNQGVMAFKKNVKVTHPEYYFSCDGEVKVILSKKHLNKSTLKNGEKVTPNDKFEGISKLIATDNVVIVGNDKDGNAIAARAGNLIYDHESGAIILRGLNSRITLPDKQIKIVEKQGYIKIDKDWHVTANGAQIDINLEKIQQNANNNN